MNSTVAKWGNSLAVRIPNSLARTLNIEERTAVVVEIEDGALVVRPLGRRKFDLDALVARITDENVHPETSTGASVGNEV